MKRAVLTLLLLTLAASVAGTPRANAQKGGGYLDNRSDLETGAVITQPAVPRGASSVLDATSMPAPSGAVGTALIGGWASWYDDPRKTGLYAAAGPLLREALGDWRGKVIRVTAGNRATLVVLSDWCACGERHGIPTIIDLSPEAFADLAPLSQGLVRVEIEVLALPATDTPDQSGEDPPEHEADRRMRAEDR